MLHSFAVKYEIDTIHSIAFFALKYALSHDTAYLSINDAKKQAKNRIWIELSRVFSEINNALVRFSWRQVKEAQCNTVVPASVQ